MSAESSPRGGASPRSQAGEPGVLDNGTGLADDEAVRRSFRDGFVPEWLRRAVEEARSLPDLLQLEADAWSFGEHSASAAVAPADSTLRFAFKVFRPMFDGGIGAAALAGSRGIAAALAGAGGGPGTNRRGADSKGAAATAGNDASASGGVAPGADVAGDLDEQTIEDELVDADLSGRNAAHALAARGMPTREPSPEPYLPLTDRRPVRAPARVPTLEHELQLLSAKEAASLRIAEAQAALEQGRSAKLDLQAHVDTDGVDATPRMLSSGQLSTKASWSGWRRAPVRPVVERALRSKASGSRRGRSKGSADLAHFAPELAGKSLKDLGAGDLFELARLEGDRKLARLIESVETSRGQAQLLRASAVERQLSCASIANLTEEAMPLIRADAEIARTVQAELQASGTAWFTDLLRTLAGMQTRKDVLPVQLLLLAQAREEFQRGRQPGPASLRSVLLRITRDEFASPVAQLLFAFFRRVARIPLEQWRELATESGMPRPAEVFIADAMKARASAGHSASAHSRYTRVRK
ncbi:hypothetical protein FNF29_01151 [Cafeteria roenbergensis]|uniref:Uncharacterized protein n=1 Tax=Cafeteria roenbergensis TaxID=33653 RepID=A0A5A8CUD2_CAFRO|nr:hypothetical protein FNF29_01151 [Cafeteria roenbergensis]|eukprot:KAA0156358.1 hypothetical protein FNF29_01151 [Cafeteria roenbergensis]